MGDTKRSSSQYAVDSLGNLLDHRKKPPLSSLHLNLTLPPSLNPDLSAKYWLRNRLDKENVIVDGFYDFGSAGVTSSKHNMPFPSLETLKGAPIDKKREVILIDARADAQFNSLVTSVTDGLAQLRPVDQIRRIAEAVVSAFGGPVANSGKVSELGFKFKAAELKLQCESNVIPIGMFKYGTFYHRALLFKAICDRVGVSPCTLVRGDYNRAWNEIDLKRWAIQSPKLPASAPATSAAKPNQKKTATMVEPPAAPSALERRPSNPGLSGGAGGGGGGGVTEVYPNFGMTVEPGQEAVLVDLMFEPGRLLEISSPAAIEYQHS